MTAEPPPNLPLTGTVDFSLQRHFTVIPRSSHFFASAVEGPTRSDFFFSAHFPDTSLRVDPFTRSLRLAPRSLGRDDKNEQARKSTVSDQGEGLARADSLSGDLTLIHVTKYQCEKR